MSQDAISLLKQQHKSAREALEALAHTTERGLKTRHELLAKLRSELTQHMLIEEEIFYPAFKAAVERKKDKRLYYEAQEEHKAAKTVLKDLMRADPASVAFGAKAKVLKELIEHHVEEEEQEMFPRAREAFDKQELGELAERMQTRQQAIAGGRAWDRAVSASDPAE
jgi:iron-sulfur cluster repair protein YtfE (RIC family)